jgi:uncharacterized protein YbaA (DUF1428 family)
MSSAVPRSEPKVRMPYIEGFVAAVPRANKAEYVKQAREVASPTSRGWARPAWWSVWGDDMPKGVLTDYYRATQAKDGETPIFSWIEYPDKATRDANEKMRADGSMASTPMPFDGKRMFWAGFPGTHPIPQSQFRTPKAAPAPDRFCSGATSNKAASLFRIHLGLQIERQALR